MKISPPWNDLAPEQKLRRHIESIAVYYFLVAVIWAFLAAWAIFSGTVGGVVFAASVAALFTIVGRGLKQFRPVARYVAYCLSVPLFFAFPIGTIVAIYSAVFLTKGKALFVASGGKGA
jgi:predicted PurR-regulated permease PerM